MYKNVYNKINKRIQSRLNYCRGDGAVLNISLVETRSVDYLCAVVVYEKLKMLGIDEYQIVKSIIKKSIRKWK